MLFKVDENLHEDVAVVLRTRGHDAATVFDEGLQGHPDTDIARVCQHEGRALITLDLDFANIQSFPPQNYPGLIVLRVTDQSRPQILRVLGNVCDLIDREPLVGCLWIVEENRIRIRAPDAGTQPP